MNKKSPSYVVRQDCGYCFRMTVPPDLQALVGKRELRYALRTGFLGEAKCRARQMAGFVQGLFGDIRKGGEVGELSEAEIKKLIDGQLHELHSFVERHNVNATEPWDRRAHTRLLKAYETVQEQWRDDLARNDYADIRPRVDALLKEKGIALDEDSFSYKKLCREMLKTQVKEWALERAIAQGDYSQVDRIMPLQTPSPTQQKQEPTGESLSKVIELYVEEQERGGNWSHKSRVEYGACLNLLKEYLGGDTPVKAIDHAKMREYKQALMKLPPNMNKSPLYRDKSLAEILKMPVTKTWATPTVNKYIQRASSLFEYAEKNGLIDKNPAKGMEIRTAKRSDEQRSVFTIDDLAKLFRSPAYMEDTHLKSYFFWVPILGLFTGCRLEEIAQLHLEDIKEVEGVWVFDINDQGEKKIKTGAGVRHVPIHPFLLADLKFAEYAEHLRSRGEQRLFPELNRGRDGYGQIVSKWFNERYKVKCGIVAENGERKDFHSFRHTFINTLKQSRVDGTMLAEVVGHSVDSMTMGTYGKRYAPRVLLEEVVGKLTFEGLDLSHLKASRFVRGE